MKLNHLLSAAIPAFLLFSCTQPMANSLLVNSSQSCNSIAGCTDTTTGTDSGGPTITATGGLATAPVELTDRVEITGSCNDLGRKNNRILVEVYAGEDESSRPYVDNTTSDACQPTSNPTKSDLETVFINAKSVVMGTSQTYTFSASGGVLPYTYSIIYGGGAINAGTGAFTSPVTNGTSIVQVVDAAGVTSRSVISTLSGLTAPAATLENKKCLVVTKGNGLIDNGGVFPQCHNGEFGFSVRLGKVLVNPSAGQPNLKYLVRYKLRTIDGTISDSVWGRVSVDRSLSPPVIKSAVNVHASQKCTIKNSPARFSPGVLYTLNRTYTDILATSVGSVNLFTNANTLVNTAGTSVFEWDDVGLTDGVTYNYTLTGNDQNYTYSPTAVTTASTVMSCRTKKIYVKVNGIPTANTCYLSLSDDDSADSDGDVKHTYFNPYVTYEWGYSNASNSWTGADGKTNSGYVSGTCGNTAVCTEGGLSAATTYYFALRAKNTMTGEIGRWSPPVACKTP